MNAAQEQPFIKSLFRRQIILTIFVVSLVAVGIWIGMTIYFSLNKSSIPSSVQRQIQPLTPVLDIKTLQELKQRKLYPDEVLSTFPLIKEITETDEKGLKKTAVTVEAGTAKKEKEATGSASQKTGTSSATPR